jgi:peroxiredoxin
MGTPMPAFSLPDALGQVHDQTLCSGPRGTLVIFMCNHCPFVVHVAEAIAALGAEFTPQGIGFVAINSNDIEAYPQDGPEHMITFARRYGLTFPYVLDQTQNVAKAFKAACTPDYFLYANDHTLVYHGQLDASRPGDGTTATGCDLQAAMNAVINGEPIHGVQVPSLGCNIKWTAPH